jgi:phasin family protein
MPDDTKTAEVKPVTKTAEAKAAAKTAEVKPVERRQAPERKQENGNPYTAMVEGNQQVFTRWLHGMFGLFEEISRFTQARMQEDMAAWSTLASCRSPEEAVECQRRFAAKAAEQYSDEMNRLSQLMVKMSVAVPPVRPE